MSANKKQKTSAASRNCHRLLSGVSAYREPTHPDFVHVFGVELPGNTNPLNTVMISLTGNSNEVVEVLHKIETGTGNKDAPSSRLSAVNMFDSLKPGRLAPYATTSPLLLSYDNYLRSEMDMHSASGTRALLTGAEIDRAYMNHKIQGRTFKKYNIDTVELEMNIKEFKFDNHMYLPQNAHGDFHQVAGPIINTTSHGIGGLVTCHFWLKIVPKSIPFSPSKGFDAAALVSLTGFPSRGRGISSHFVYRQAQAELANPILDHTVLDHTG